MRDWPAFRAAATETDVRSAFSFPLEVDAVRLGALSIYRDAVARAVVAGEPSASEFDQAE